jgi:hypothetical protein
MNQASLMGFFLRDGEKVPAASRGRMGAPTQPFPGGADMEKEFVVFTRSESRGGFIETPGGQVQYLDVRMWYQPAPDAKEISTPWMRMRLPYAEEIISQLQQGKDALAMAQRPTTPSHPKH